MVNQRNRARRKTKDKPMHSRAVCHDSIVRVFSSVFLDVPLVLIEPLKISVINQSNKALSQFNCSHFPLLRLETGGDDSMCFPLENPVIRATDRKPCLYLRRRR